MQRDNKMPMRLAGAVMCALLGACTTLLPTGWRFNALVVLKDDLVVYKLWGGQPTIRETEKDTRPLGPLQNLGESLRPRL